MLYPAELRDHCFEPIERPLKIKFFARRNQGLCINSTSTPPMSFGWMKIIGVPCAPMRGSPVPSTRAPFATISSRAAIMSSTSKQIWCWPPAGFASKNRRLGLCHLSVRSARSGCLADQQNKPRRPVLSWKICREFLSRPAYRDKAQRFARLKAWRRRHGSIVRSY